MTRIGDVRSGYPVSMARMLPDPDRLPPLSGLGRLLLAGGLVSLAVGLPLLLATDGGTSTAGLGLLGIAIVCLVSLAFLLVGESEDRFRRRHPRG